MVLLATSGAGGVALCVRVLCVLCVVSGFVVLFFDLDSSRRL